MTALFRVRVEGCESKICQLRFFIIHPDQKRFYASLPFALQVLWDGAENRDAAHLTQTISLKQRCDSQFVVSHCEEFIESVEYLERRNYPRSIDFESMSSNEFQEYWKNEYGLPQSVLQIIVTDSRWIAHMNIGMTWETSAYNM